MQTAVTMRQVTGSMANVVRGMDGAMKAMDLEKVNYPSPPRRVEVSFTDVSAIDIQHHGQIRNAVRGP